MRLSTAAHLSARFPIVSPVAELSRSSHVVDGGYFENSGGATAFELYERLDLLAKSPAAMKPSFVPMIILISNDPNDPTITGRRRPPGVSRQVIPDVAGPVSALLRAREARAPYTKKMMLAAINKDNPAADTSVGEATRRMFVFSLQPKSVPLPLGWMLSKRAAGAIGQQMDDGSPTGQGVVPTSNHSTLEEIVTLLRGVRP